MAKVPGKSTRYYIDHHALSGVLSAIDMNVTQEAPDVTCISDVGPRAVIGNYGHTHALRGFFDGSSSNIDAVGNALIGTTSDHYLGELFGGNAEGSICYESMVQLTGEPIKTAVAGAVMLDINLTGAGGLARSHVIASGTVATTTGLLSSVDQGVATTNGTYQSVLRAISGTFTNVVLQVQDSSNGTTWADSAGLTATFTAPGVSRVTTTGSLLQYKRVTATTFAGTSVEVLVTGGIIAGSLTPTS